jgi:hypothetical protein
MRRKLVVMFGALAVAAALIGVAVHKRQHVAMEATGEWYCSNEYCSATICGSCSTQARAMCFSVRSIISGKEGDYCYSSPTFCEGARRRALADLDLDGVGACRVVSAATDDREAYLVYAGAAWCATGASAVVITIPWIWPPIATWRRRRASGPDEEWRRKLKKL